MQTVLRKVLVVVITWGLLCGGGGNLPAWADTPQTQCPVMGGAIDKKVYADYQGKRIYFCCSACVPEFKKDPEKYLKKMSEAGITPEATPAGAEKPASGAPKAGK